MSSAIGGNRLSLHSGLMQASAAAEKELASAGAILYRRHITLDDLISHIRFQMARRRPELARSPASGGWRWLCARACVSEAEKLDFSRQPDFARAFRNSFAEFFRVVDLLHSTPEDIWPEGLKGRWLKSVYEALRAELQSGAMFSDGDIMREFLAQESYNCDLPLLHSFDGLDVCGFVHLYPLQLQTLLHISNYKPLRFIFNYDPENDRGGGHPALELIRAIESKARDLNVEIEFASQTVDIFEPANSAGLSSVKLVECAGREDEVNWCSAQVRALLDSGIKPGDIALICSDIEGYRPYLRRQIREQAMPYAYRRSSGILSAPALRWLPLLPEALSQTVRVEAVAALADSLRMVLPDLWPLDDAQNTGCIAALRRKGIFELKGRGWLSAFVQGDERELLEKLADALEALRARFSRDAELRQHIEGFIELLSGVTFCLPDNSDDRRHFSLDWHALQIASRVLEEWRSVVGADMQAVSGLYFLRELTDELERSIRLRSSPEPDVVAVLSPEEASGLKYEHIFWLGLIEGAYPPSFGGGILSDTESRNFNRRAGAHIWPDSRASWLAAREVFRALLQNAGQAVLSYYRDGEDGEEKQPSPFYLELRELKRAGGESLLVQKLTDSDMQASRTLLMKMAAQSDYLDALKGVCGGDVLERLAQKAEIEDDRRRFFVFSSADEAPGEYTGLVPDFCFDDPPLLNHGAFETYAQCPFRYFVHYLLKPGELPEEIFEIEPREIGTVLHDIMKNIAVSGGGLWSDSASDENLRQVAGHIEAEFRRIAPQYDDARLTLALLRSREWSERLGDYLQRASSESDNRTIMCEAGFGAGRRSEQGLIKELEFTGPAGTRFHLNGRIDRVDWDGQTLRAVDYKTGSASNGSSLLKPETWGVENFQMPIYLLALQRSVLAGELHLEPQNYSARIVALKDKSGVKDYELRPPLAADDAFFCGDEFIEKLEIIIMRASDGDFRIAPSSCRACPWPAVCRVLKQTGKND